MLVLKAIFDDTKSQKSKVKIDFFQKKEKKKNLNPKITDSVLSFWTHQTSLSTPRFSTQDSFCKWKCSNPMRRKKKKKISSNEWKIRSSPLKSFPRESFHRGKCDSVRRVLYLQNRGIANRGERNSKNFSVEGIPSCQQKCQLVLQVTSNFMIIFQSSVLQQISTL